MPDSIFFLFPFYLSLEPPYLLLYSILLHLSTYFSVSYLLHSSLALLIFFVFLMSVTNILVCTIVTLFFYSSKLTGVGGLMVSSWLFLHLHNSVTHQLWLLPQFTVCTCRSWRLCPGPRTCVLKVTLQRAMATEYYWEKLHFILITVT